MVPFKPLPDQRSRRNPYFSIWEFVVQLRCSSRVTCESAMLEWQTRKCKEFNTFKDWKMSLPKCKFYSTKCSAIKNTGATGFC